MISIPTVIPNLSICAAIRIGFLLYMSISIFLGELSQYLEKFENNEIELIEEKDTEPEEKRDKEENEKDEFMAKVFSYDILSQAKPRVHHSTDWCWTLAYKDIPTPPPKGHMV